MTLTFSRRTNFVWYALLQWCWGLTELATHETKREDKVVIANTISLVFIIYEKSTLRSSTNLLIRSRSLLPSSDCWWEDIWAPGPLHTHMPSPMILLLSSCILGSLPFLSLYSCLMPSCPSASMNSWPVPSDEANGSASSWSSSAHIISHQATRCYPMLAMCESMSDLCLSLLQHIKPVQYLSGWAPEAFHVCLHIFTFVRPSHQTRHSQGRGFTDSDEQVIVSVWLIHALFIHFISFDWSKFKSEDSKGTYSTS